MQGVGIAARNHSEIIAVLTGDLVSSRDMTVDQLSAARIRMEQVGATIDAWRPGLVIGKPQFFRGDSWQMALADAGMFLRAAIAIRAALRQADAGLETRIGIGIGTVDSIDPTAISLSTGDAFTRSGHALDEMKSDSGFRLSLPPDMAKRMAWLSAMLALCDALIGRWQPAQAAAMLLGLSPNNPTQQAVADQLGIQRQTVQQALTTAGLQPLRDAVAAVEQANWTASHPKVQVI